jgi:transposase
MENTLQVGDRVVVNKVVYHLRPVQRGDVIVFDGSGIFTPEVSPTGSGGLFAVIGRTLGALFGLAPPNEQDFIKRVIGVGGDRVVCCNSQGQITVNGIALALLAGSFFYLDSYRKQLLAERFKLARAEAEIAAIALTEASPAQRRAVLAEIGTAQKLRLTLYDAHGALVADSFRLAPPPFAFADPERIRTVLNAGGFADIAVAPHNENLDHLPHEEVVIEPDSKVCPCCKGELHVIGEDVSKRLDKQPAKLTVVVTKRPKYACRTCEKTGADNVAGVIQAPAPARLIEGGLPTERLVADVIVSKHADHLPLYRQSQISAL